MKSLQLARAVAGKRWFDHLQPADASVPMGAKVGSLLTFKVGPFLRAAGSLVTKPDSRAQVVSISRVRVPVDGAIHRLYSARGDAAADAPEAFVEVFTDAKGVLQELAYYCRLLRVIPTSAEEQAAYMGEGGQGLGQATFTIQREQLAAAGASPTVLDDVFAGADCIEYVRSAGEQSIEFVAPYQGIENRIDDRSGEHGLQQEVVFMPYERTLAGGVVEKLVIATEIVKDRDGDAGAREIHVDFMIGLTLAKEDVMIQ